MSRLLAATLPLILLALGCSDLGDPVAPETGDPQVELLSFQADVLPIFTANCITCHGAGLQNGGLRLDSYQGLMAGGNSGVAVVAGEPASGSLVPLIAAGAMPPTGGLPQAERDLIQQWIAEGAADN